ncbi:WYL2 beta-barrel domain-containing protein [Pseudomonas phage EM]|uniref:WYL2 beta-barrel domain-containing protein n=1 Tax=Pseudomonas phage EM TaxID=2936914 RepID=A0AAE9HG72_9CAUD|nr:WYL2 beta-barrel domain-containing protein [Pseudomonas phage EM]UPW35963.1 WYL2 beta-barrel domain-containing protein [Pseudomonas phage EM]
MAKAVSVDRKRAILDEARDGSFFSVEFVKKDGTVRTMTCKRQIKSAYANGQSASQKPTSAGKPHLYCAAEVLNAEEGKAAYRTINLETLVRAKVNGIEYRFDLPK